MERISLGPQKVPFLINRISEGFNRHLFYLPLKNESERIIYKTFPTRFDNLS